MRSHLAVLSALAIVCVPAVASAQSVPLSLVPLAPGIVVGHVNTYSVRRGDSVATIAAFHGVNPVRVRKPSKGALKDGLETGEEIFIDQRRVTPAFYPWVDGIVLNVPEAEVYFVDQGRLVRSYPVAVSRSDWTVPIGQFKVIDKTKNPIWFVPKTIQAEMLKHGEEVKTQVPAGPDNPLGDRWIGFADGTYGFHGTTTPTSIKRYASHGCVRFFQDDIHDLYDRVEVGTPVRVYYQPVTMAVDNGAVWLAVYPDIYGRDYDFKGAVEALARQANVLGLLNWKTVGEALEARDGILRNVSRPSADETRAASPTQEVVPTMD